VQIDLESAGYQATSHLLEHGHNRIGLVTVSMEAANVNAINQGYERALSETGQMIDGRLIARVPGFSISNGIEGARRLLNMEKPPTALFCVADTLALGAMQTIKQSGLTIPSDVALASFNDIPSAALVEPPLTTVSAPTIQMGQEAMRMLQSLIDGRKSKKDRVILPPALVIRQSCGPH
jgi:DNA-binding LacI/PurR family transcriptional regulator